MLGFDCHLLIMGKGQDLDLCLQFKRLSGTGKVTELWVGIQVTGDSVTESQVQTDISGGLVIGGDTNEL